MGELGELVMLPQPSVLFNTRISPFSRSLLGKPAGAVDADPENRRQDVHATNKDE